MGAYDEIEIEDMTWNEELQAYTYNCPCGDLFQITLVRGHLPRRRHLGQRWPHASRSSSSTQLHRAQSHAACGMRGP